MALRRKFTQTKFFRALAVSVVLVVFIIFPPRFITEPLQSVVATVAAPFEGMLSVVGYELRDFFSFFSSIGDLKNENERLRKENVRLLAETSKWQAVSHENEELRRELDLLPREKYTLRAAEVIGRDAAGVGNFVTLNQGSFQGVEKGMSVIVDGGVLVGRIAEVFPQSSHMMLLSHPESRVSAISVESSTQGIVKGEHSLGMLFDMVLQADSLQTGDRVVTSGLGGEIPKDLFVGTLQNVRLSDDHLYQQASLVSSVKFESLRYVFIIQNTK